MKIEKLIFKNFKGIRDLTLEFDEKLTNVFGSNATGKTTVFDGFLWLLTEKDSLDRKSFEIKTLDKQNKYIHRLVHSVEGHFRDEGSKIILRREYKEKWQKKRGDEEDSFTGHETDHFVDGVPSTKREYQDVVDRIIPESVLKLISNPYHFPNLKWDEKRKIVLQIAGEPTLQEVADGVKKYEELLKIIDGRDLEQWRRMIAAERKEIKKEKDDIPPRINELQEYIPEEPESEIYESQLESVDIEISKVNAKIRDKKESIKGNTEAYEALQRELSQLEREYNEKFDAEKQKFYDGINKKADELFDKIEQLKQEDREANANRKDIEYELRRRTSALSDLKDRRKELLDEYHKVNARSFKIKETDSSCYACGQPLPDAEKTIKENKQKFIDKQKQELKEIKEKGTEISEEIAEAEKEFNRIYKDVKKKLDAPEIDNAIKIQDISNEIKELRRKEFTMPEGHKELMDAIKAKKAKIADFKFATVDTAELDERLHELHQKRDAIQKELTLCEEAEKIIVRIDDLKAKEKKYAAEIARIEKLEFDADGLVKRKITMMEKSIKEKFNGVHFKMYRELINGGEEPTCEILIDGVPFDNANRAAQINTGIKIINALSEYYSRTAPIFIDNAEAVNQLEPTDSQLIRLVVVEPGFKNEDGILLKPIK